MHSATGLAAAGLGLLLVGVLLGAGAGQGAEAFLRTWVHAEDQPVRTLDGGRAEVQLLLDRSSGIASASLSRIKAKPGYTIKEHRHADSEELIFVLRGGGTMTLGKHRVALEEDMALWVPRGKVHSFVAGPEGFEAIQVYAPGGPEERFKARPPGPGPR